eukprot:gene6835-8719_t
MTYADGSVYEGNFVGYKLRHDKNAVFTDVSGARLNGNEA